MPPWTATHGLLPVCKWNQGRKKLNKSMELIASGHEWVEIGTDASNMC